MKESTGFNTSMLNRLQFHVAGISFAEIEMRSVPELMPPPRRGQERRR